MADGFWNGQPAVVRRARVVVGDSGRFSRPWFAEFVGTERDAVEVMPSGGRTFYIDDEDGNGWRKVIEGRGSPRMGHAGLDVERVVAYRDDESDS